MKRVLLFIVILSVLLMLCSCTSKTTTINLVESVFKSLRGNFGDGEGVRVAVIDSGINDGSTNSEYALNFSEEDNTHDKIDHGTPIINIISNKEHGLAPKATVYSLKVINKYGNASTQAVYNALQWCLNNSIDLINMSLSFGLYSENIECIISELVDKGVIIVSSINNNDTQIDYPSMYDGIICVGRLTDSLDKYSKERSIIFLDDFEVKTVGVSGELKDYAGNSYLTPVVTGIVACLIDKNNMKGSVSNAELISMVRAILSQSNVRVK